MRRTIAETLPPGSHRGTTEIIALVQEQCRARRLTTPSVSTIRRRLKAARSADRTFATQPQADSGSVANHRQTGHRAASADTDAALLGLLYETVGNPAGWQPFLHALTEASHFNRATLSLHDAALQCGEMGAQVNFDAAAVDAYARHYAAINPWLARPAERPVGVVLTTEHVVRHSDLLKTEYYHDFCRPHGMDLAVGLTVVADGARSMVVSAMGRRDDLDRDRHIVGRFRRLAPHLLRVAQLSRQLAGLEMRAVAAERALDRLATAMVVVNRSGQLVHLNAAAERIVAAGDGLSITNKKLTAATPGATQTLMRLIAEALQALSGIEAAPGGMMRVTRRSAQTPYEILVTPLSNRTLGLDLSGPLAAVFVRDPETRVTAPVDRLRHLYALTAAEARLMQALLAGETLDVVADRFSVGKETLRSQLKSVFLKTGTSSQIELLRLGLRGLAAFEG